VTLEKEVGMGWKSWWASRRAQKLYREGLALFQRTSKSRTPEQTEQARGLLSRLHNALESEDEVYLEQAASDVEERIPELCPEAAWKGWARSIGFLALAIAVIVPIRQMWFELYVIPTGSMRPTFKEQDRLLVSKTAFGINHPYKSGQLWNDPALLRAGEIIVFGTEGVALQDGWDRFLWLIPVRKQLVKRCMGLPGHTLYFYGGQVYAVDEKGRSVEAYREPLWVRKRDYIPVMRFEGSARTSDQGRRRELVQWNQPLAGWSRNMEGRWIPELDLNGVWKEDRGLSAVTAYPQEGPQSYADLWGIRHHALCRLLVQDPEQSQWGPDCVALLEVAHSPTLSRPRRLGLGGAETFVVEQRSVIPLGSQEIEHLKRALYTIRFVVKDGYAFRYSHEQGSLQPGPSTPRLEGVPDGTYEFYDGRAVSVGFGGLTTELPDNHPLYADALFPKLFNLGIEFHEAFSHPKGPMPSRWAYFRHGDLYVMGKMVWAFDSPHLKDFLARQEQQSDPTVLPFKDWGAPTPEQIKQFGYKVPSTHLIALGDNHAQSGDSRDFGPVPVGNLLGSPSVLFWPWSEGRDRRIGSLPQPDRSWVTLPNLLINGLGLTGLVGYELWAWRRRRQEQKAVEGEES
jgi:signal peptidase I